MPEPIILASSSPYRQAILARLGLPFATQAPNLDERRHRGETPAATALRLAQAKALAVTAEHPNAVVIGADQVLDLQGMPLGKPGNHEAAVAQLQLLSGQQAVFHSAVAVVSPIARQSVVVPCWAQFISMTPSQIDSYLRAEKPYDTAGSAKAESLGITLLSCLRSDDPTAIIGLPLIELTRMLRRIGIDPLTPARTD